MTTEEMFAEILAKLDEKNALWYSPTEQLTSLSPPSMTIPTANTEDPERGVPISAHKHPNSKPSMAFVVASTSSLTLTPPLDITLALSIIAANFDDDYEHEVAKPTTSNLVTAASA
jgi:hypothetical protein